MLRISKCLSSEGARRYFDAALKRSDYYTSEMGLWGGRAAGLLGLSGEVSRDDFVALAENRKPGTDERLTARTNDVRKEKAWATDPKTGKRERIGKEVANRRAGYDFTFSVPKSVSLYVMETGDKAVERMIDESFVETMADVENRMETRVRKGGEQGERNSGNIVYAAFVHRETRPVEGVPDPHYHIHAFTFNATLDPVENQWKAIEIGNTAGDRVFYEAGFHARLAARLLAGGYAIRRTDRDFELASVSRELIEKFSKRTRLIERLARQKYTVLEAKARVLMKETGMDWADAFAEIKSRLGAESREKKTTIKVGPEEQLANWRSQMTPAERDSLRKETVRAAVSQNLIGLDEAKALTIGHLFERSSVARELHAAAMFLRRAIGGVGVAEAETFAQSPAEFIRAGGKLVTTREVLEHEHEMIETALAGRERFEELGRGGKWVYVAEVVGENTEQKTVVEGLLKSRDLVIAVHGPAGSGKTTLMREAVTAIETLSGKSVLVCAPSSSAVKILKSEGFTRADTFQQLAQNEVVQDAVRGQVLWVDEAGFLSVKQMRWLLDFAVRNKCRVILSGDTRQHHGVERGDALRVMEVAGAVARVALSKIFRQQVPALRAAIEDLSQGRTEAGFDKLNAFGAIHEIEESEDRLAAIATTQLAAIKDGKSSLIVAPTHGECRTIATAVRHALKAEGLLGPAEFSVSRLQRLGFTESQRGDAINYEVGQVVEFHRRASGGFKSGERWEVAERRSKSVKIVKNGEAMLLPLSNAKSFDVYEPEDISLAAGDAVRITKNFSSGRDRFKNNELCTVAAIDEGSIAMSDGRMIKRAGSLHLDQGIAVTSHASQGKTVDQVIASMPVEAFNQTNEAQFYVSMSRARQAMHLFTDSIAALREAVVRPSKRLSPWELIAGMNNGRVFTASVIRAPEMKESKTADETWAYER